MQNQDLNLVLSTDAKPRLKWTPELHQRFVDAIIQLGGTDKATPKSLMRVMGIPGLTLYHLKSHLQKYRLGKNHTMETCSNSNQEDYKENKGTLDLFSEEISDETKSLQRKLYEQIEVQRHLQLRIEAQGKYLEEVMKKAQETLAAYTSSSMGVDHTRAELSHLVSMVNSRCPSPSLSELTEARALSLENLDNQLHIKRYRCSTESSLTSSEDSGMKNDNKLNETRVTLPLLDQPLISGLTNQPMDRKRKRSSIYERNCGDGDNINEKKPTKIGLFGTLDLNSKYEDDQDLVQSTIGHNSIQMEQYHGASKA